MSKKRHLNSIIEIFSNISSLLDIQCGKPFEVEKNLAGNGNLTYFGIDLRQNLIEQNRQHFRGDCHKIFLDLDASNETLPKVDLVFCLNFLSHLPVGNMWSTLENINASGAKYFLTDFDLTKAPFYFPKPTFLLPSFDSKAPLHFYKISQISYFMDQKDEKSAKIRLQLFEVLEEEMEFLSAPFDDHKMFEKTIADFLVLDGNTHSKIYYRDEPYHSIMLRSGALPARDNLFRIIYQIEFDLLDKKYFFIKADDFLLSRVLLCDYIRWKFNLNQFSKF
jgi:hypothetical protein